MPSEDRPESPSPEAPRWPLDIREDMTVQRRSWRAERVGFALMALVIAAALLGLFGSGPLARTNASSADGTLTVAYNRLDRHLTPAELTVMLRPRQGKAEPWRTLWLGESFMRAVQIEGIHPQPTEAQAAGNSGMLLRFAATDPDGTVTVRLSLQMQSLGLTRVRLGRSEDSALWLTQFVYP